jgi:hypothetical protein
MHRQKFNLKNFHERNHQMAQTLALQIYTFLEKWKIANTDMLKSAVPVESVSNGSFRTALKRLRRRGDMLSLRVGPIWYHFDRRLKARYEGLEKFHFLDRQEKFSAWGFDHHLKVVEIGRKIERTFRQLEVTANLGSDYVSYGYGTRINSKTKFVPDLMVCRKDLDKPKYHYIEVERTIKERARYDKRWLAYEGDENLDCCLYWVFDRYHEKRLERFMEKYFRAPYISENFRMALLLDENFERSRHEPAVSTFSFEGMKSKSFWESLFPKCDTWTPSRSPEIFESRESLNHFNRPLGEVELTSLTHPCTPDGFQDVALPARGRLAPPLRADKECSSNQGQSNGESR